MKREQHWDALERANEVRRAQTELKREIAAVKPMSASCHALADALELSDPNGPGYADYLRNVTCIRYLKWGRGIGTTKANRILRDAVVGPHRTLSELTNRERSSLERAVRSAADLTPPESSEGKTWAEQVITERVNA